MVSHAAPSAFADTFGELVVPRLYGLARRAGFRVGLGTQTFNDAINQVMAEARRLGALHLSDADYVELEDYVLSTILEAADEMDRHLSERETEWEGNVVSLRRYLRDHPAFAKAVGHNPHG